MKYIIQISMICLLANFMAFGQSIPNTQINTFCEDGGFESGVINMSDFRYGFGNNFTPNRTNDFTISRLTLYPPPSGGFPNSWSGIPSNSWGNSGNFVGKFYELITNPTPANALIEDPTSNLSCCYFSPIPQNQIHHQIQTVGPDLALDALLPRVHSGNYSMRLGNAAVDAGAEIMQKTFDVTPATALLSFWYAVVMGDPCEANEIIQMYDTNTGQLINVPCPSAHQDGAKTNFMVKIYNHTDGTFHDNLVNLGAGQNFISNQSPLLTNVWNYRRNNILQMQEYPIKYAPWSFVSIPLNTLIGKRISVYFITTDCNARGHYAYAYLDDFCTEPGPDNPSGSIQIQGNLPDCGPDNICVDYTLPVLPDGSIGEVNLSFNIYQNGNLVNTLSSGTLTSGSEYCFNINNALLNSLNGTHFDYVVTGDFNINGVSLPSQNIGVPGYGQNTTQNDDYQINCNDDPEPCCDLPDLQVSIRKPKYGSDQLSLVIGGITTPIQEIEVSVADYHFSYGDPACQPANLGVFGNLSSNQSSLNGLNLSGSGTQVISWKAGSPAVFNGQIPLKISKPNILKLSCCKGTFSVCLKVKLIDVNCNVCEKLVCIELPLEDQTLQQFPGDTKPIDMGNLDPGNGTPVLGPNEVYNPVTGKIWLNKNLGASQVATSPTDSLAYGDLYQWGRLTDGHEKRTSSTTTTLSSSDVPGHGDFILHPNFPAPFTWNSPQNINLWQGVNGTNNPCPSGYRIPTDGELAAEQLSWTTPDAAGAFASPLKWTLAGFRFHADGQIINAGLRGSYWSSWTNGAVSIYMNFINGNSSISSTSYQTADGASVRCIKN